jgi:DNA-binding response OmpR family regulator
LTLSQAYARLHPIHSVLVVDDDPAVRRRLANQCAAHGHLVATASSVGAALREAESLSPEVIVLDLRLPDASGRELALRLRRGPGGRPRIVLVSGVDDLDDAARDLGAFRALPKPVRPADVVAAVEEALATA